MNLKNILKLLFAVIIIIAITFYLYKNDEFKILSNCNASEFFILICITYAAYLVNGYQMYFLVHEQNRIKLTLPDILILPLSMSLFAYIIPTNGGLLYSVYFLKKKYGIDTSKGFSIGIFSVYLSLIISGIIGLVIAFISIEMRLALILISIIFIFMPLIVYAVNLILQNIKFKKAIVIKFQTYIDSMVVGSNSLMIDKKVAVVNIVISFVQIVITFISYYWLVLMLDIKIAAASLVLIVLLLRISGLIRILPGNLGIEELFAAGIFGATGFSPSTGMLFSILLRFSTFFLIIPFGIFHTVFNSESLKLSDLKQILKVSSNKKNS